MLCPKNHSGPIAPNLHTRLQSPCGTKFKINWQGVGYKILNKMRGYLWKSGKWLPRYAQNIILDPLVPNLYNRAQPPWGSKFSIKKVWSFLHGILNETRGFLCKSGKGLPSFASKTILGPFAPNSLTRPQSLCGTKFSKRKTGKVLVIKFWTNWGVIWKSGKWLPSYAQKIILVPFAPDLYNRAQPPWGTKF